MAIRYFILAGLLALGACTAGGNGDAYVLGIDTHVKSDKLAADAKLFQADVQKAIDTLPSLCQKFSIAVKLTQAELAVLTATAKLPAKTAANISNASAKGQLICDGTAAVVAPLASQ